MGVLFRRGERWRLAVSVAGSIGIALLDTLSVLLVSPLIQAMGDSWRQGTAGTVARMLGLTTQTSLVASLLAMVIGGFVLKDLAAVAFNWWSLGFTASVRTRAQVEMTEYYMRLPYYHHAHLGLAVILRKTMVTVAQAYGAFANSVIGIFVQIFSVALMVTALLVSSPLITLTLLAFLGVAGVVFLRIIKPVNQRLGREQVELSEKSYGLAIDAFGAIKETQLRNSYEYFMRSMTGPIRRGAQIERVVGFVSALPKQTMEILFMLGLGVVFAVSAGDGVSSDMLATIALLVAAAFRLLPTVAGLMGSVANIRHAEAGTREYVESRLASLRPRVGVPVHVRPRLPAAGTAFVVTWAVGGFYQSFIPSITAEQLGSTSAVVIALVFSAYMLPGAFGAPLAGLLPAERAQRIGIAVWLVGLWAVLASLVAGSVVAFIGFTVLAGAGQGVAVAASMRSLLHGVTLMDRAPVMSATYLISYGGAMTASLVAGQLSKVLDIVPIAMGYGVLGALGAAIVWARAAAPVSPSPARRS